MKSDNNVIVILSAILILLLGISGLLVGNQFSHLEVKKGTTFSFSQTGVKATPTSTPTVLGASSGIFSSNQLGIKFSYNENKNEPIITVDQTARTVSLQTGTNSVDDSILTVLSKSIDQTFYQAVGQYVVRQGGNLSKCLVTIDDPQTFSEYENANYVTATVKNKVSIAIDRCPIASPSDFLVMDLRFPDRFVVIHKGGTPIYADSTKKQSWEQTLIFF